MEYKIVLVKVEQRTDSAEMVQGILTDFGCSIKVRLGLHDVPCNTCSPAGLLFLQVSGDSEPIKEMVDELNAVDSVTAKYLEI
jgi:hypothetical protein